MKTSKLNMIIVFILMMIISPSGKSNDLIITKSFTGSWYNLETSGQGFLIEVIKVNGQKKALATWFTFDTNGNQMWLIGVGDIQAQQISFEMLKTEGGTFGNAHDPNNINSNIWGDVTVTFDNCNSASVNWTPVSSEFTSGSMPLTRLTSINNLNCSGGLSDELGDTANNLEIITFLNNTSLIAGASGKAKYEERSDRVDFSVEAEDLPIGSYDFLVEGENKGQIDVMNVAAGTQGEIEFRDPVEPGKILLDFDPRDKLIEVSQFGEVYLSSIIDGTGNNSGTTSPNAPSFGDSEIDIVLNNMGVLPAGKAEAKLEQRSDRVDFDIELEDIPLGFYDLHVSGQVVGIVEVIQLTTGVNEGELEFRNPVEPGKELLDFNPLGQLVEIVQDGVVLFSVNFPEDGGGSTNPPNTPLELEVSFSNAGVDTDASGKVDYEVRTDRKDLKVEVEDLDDGAYQLFVTGNMVATINVTNAEGEVEFRDPVEAGKLLLDFDPLNQLFEIKKDGVLYLSVVLQ